LVREGVLALPAEGGSGAGARAQALEGVTKKLAAEVVEGGQELLADGRKIKAEQAARSLPAAAEEARRKAGMIVQEMVRQPPQRP